MNWFNNLTIRTKIVSAFTLILIVTASLGAFSLQRLGAVNDGATEVAENWLVATHALGAFGTATTRYRQVESSIAIAPTPELYEREVKHLANDVLPQVQSALAEYEPTINPGEERALFNQVLPQWTAYVAANDQYQELVKKRS